MSDLFSSMSLLWCCLWNIGIYTLTYTGHRPLFTHFCPPMEVEMSELSPFWKVAVAYTHRDLEEGAIFCKEKPDWKGLVFEANLQRERSHIFPSVFISHIPTVQLSWAKV